LRISRKIAPSFDRAVVKNWRSLVNARRFA
jgi:hypothetical protein